MTKIIRILMALVLIFQILVPIKTVAATTNVNSTEEATSSALTNAKTTSSDNDASQTASEQAKTEPIEKNSNQLESVEESSNTKTKTESSNTEAINVDFSMKPIADSVLAGNVASFENILRVTGPNTVVKNMTLTYKIEGLETGKVTFDASKEVLEKLSIDGVMPSYNQESSTLTYQFKELHTGIAYKNNLEIDSNIGYIKEQQVKIVGQLEIDSETKSEKEATVLIKGTTNVALKQDHEGINLKDSDNIVWTLNLHALKKKGIIFLKENSELIIEQKIPDGLIYQSDNANGSYDAAKKNCCI
ncbi:hypothetical protein [Brochothrix campestris]|uniref:hypothetical protein n=1 Tax=Brochothrix campestris TaxID=2757 RepID=UPI000554AC0C|nr:hypothetical protein [Brochothrix campestris]